MVLIPTSFKDKLPRGLSYPIGAELLSEALAGVPQYDTLTLSFYGSAPLRSYHPTRVLAASYSNSPPGLTGSNEGIAQGWYGESWGITVSAVASDLKSVVRGKLLEAGIPRLRAWLEEPRTQTWLSGRKSCSVNLDPASLELSVSQDDGP